MNNDLHDLLSVHSSGRSIGQKGNKNIYIDFGIPGETVICNPLRRNAGFRLSSVKEVVNPSPFRTREFCPHFTQCGGCNWQHIDYEYQLQLKRQILLQALEKYQINTPPVPPVMAAPDPLHYRFRMEYAFHGLPGPSASGITGFHHFFRPKEVIAIEECQLQPPRALEIVRFVSSLARDACISFYHQPSHSGTLRSMGIRINTSGEIQLVIGLNEPTPHLQKEVLQPMLSAFRDIVSLCHTVHISPKHSQLQGNVIPAAGSSPFLFESLSGIRFRVHASSFFQPNARQAEVIFNAAREWISPLGVGTVYDLYTGVGTLALFLSTVSNRVTGIEGSPTAVADASENALLNGASHVQFLTGDILGTFNPGFLSCHGKPDLIVLDPPRSGTLIEIKKTINSSGAGFVLYLSCNPVSLAFDLKQLGEQYHVVQIQPFDMLPHTHHLETLVLLQRK